MCVPVDTHPSCPLEPREYRKPVLDVSSEARASAFLGIWGGANFSGSFGFTPGLHNKIPAYKIFARGWVAQKSFFFIGSG